VQRDQIYEIKIVCFNVEDTSVMVLAVRMSVHPQKRKELLQTVQELIQRTRKQQGCISCHFYQDIENGNAFNLVEEWKRQVDLDKHLGSDHFGVLLGAINLLSEPTEIKFNTVSYTGGMGTLKAARGLITNNPNYRKEEKL